MRSILRSTWPLLALALGGCTLLTPNYQPALETSQAVKQAAMQPAALAGVTVADPKLNKVSVRGNTLQSPYGSYDAYLREALRQELSDAGLLKDGSNIVISAVLTRNDVEAAVSKGTADLSARFTVMRDGRTAFQKDIAAHHEWESSFVGAIAIPNAANAYPIAMQKLIVALFSDPEFRRAVAK